MAASALGRTVCPTVPPRWSFGLCVLCMQAGHTAQVYTRAVWVWFGYRAVPAISATMCLRSRNLQCMNIVEVWVLYDDATCASLLRGAGVHQSWRSSIARVRIVLALL